MPETASTPEPLTHRGTDKSDERLATEASAHLARLPALQLIAELLTRLREMQLPWWTPDHLRKAYGATERMTWLTERPDVRQRITSELTGLAPKAARRKAPEFQAALIDSVIDDGDISAAEFEAAFDPTETAVYGPVSDLWRLFRRRMPWDDDATVHQDLVGWLIGALLADKSALDGAPRTPILTPWHVRTAIDGRVWHARIPLDVRVAIDEARLRRERERPGDPFHAAHDLAHAPPARPPARASSVVADEETSEPPGASPAAAVTPAVVARPPVAAPPGASPAASAAGATAAVLDALIEAALGDGLAAPAPAAGHALDDGTVDASAHDAGPELEVGYADPEDLPSIGDDDDPMARTNPWELDNGVPPIDDPSTASSSPSKRNGRRRR